MKLDLEKFRELNVQRAKEGFKTYDNQPLTYWTTALAGEVPVIAAGGITDGAKARAKLEAGAALVQVYSGLIYRGPELVRECAQACANFRVV